MGKWALRTGGYGVLLTEWCRIEYVNQVERIAEKFDIENKSRTENHGERLHGWRLRLVEFTVHLVIVTQRRLVKKELESSENGKVIQLGTSVIIYVLLFVQQVI